MLKNNISKNEPDFENFKHKFWKATLPNNYDFLNRFQLDYKVNCLKWQPNSSSINYSNNIWITCNILFSKSYLENNISKEKLSIYELKIPHEQTKIKNYNEIFFNSCFENMENENINLMEFKKNYETPDKCLNFEFKDKNNFITKCMNNQLYLYNVEEDNFKFNYEGHENIGWAFDFNENILVSGSYDNQILVFDFNNKNYINKFEDQNNSINCLKLINTNIYSISDEGYLRNYDIRSNELINEIDLDNCINSFSLDFCSNEPNLLMVTNNNKLEFFDTRNFKKMFEIYDDSTILKCKWSKSNDVIVTTMNKNGIINIWDLTKLTKSNTINPLFTHYGSFGILGDFDINSENDNVYIDFDMNSNILRYWKINEYNYLNNSN